MSSRKHYQYYVEGQCEKKLIDELKKHQLVIPGNVNVKNVTQEFLGPGHLRLLPPDTVVILLFDTDAGNPSILQKNMITLNKYRNIISVWCVCQVENLEAELVRATTVREVKALLGCQSNKDFKSSFISERYLLEKLNHHGFRLEALWSTSPGGTFSGIINDGWRIKKSK